MPDDARGIRGRIGNRAPERPQLEHADAGGGRCGERLDQRAEPVVAEFADGRGPVEERERVAWFGRNLAEVPDFERCGHVGDDGRRGQQRGDQRAGGVGVADEDDIHGRETVAAHELRHHLQIGHVDQPGEDGQLVGCRRHDRGEPLEHDSR
ncbi:hypothetical protein E3T26_13400 [Cryobacterium sp. TMT1-21]|uniref:hypothetical protein n=1 Tax=unclassified Cryobacterium TaxID=2649013 RepID=UPI00106B0292|nr:MULTISPECIES: hypothetical protein [unclassified Cryobacterium]TFC87533.1 hypothetical protein E3T24_04915 [Cryobacterium sp. TmT2-59]TFD10882.1 hypothetical protein E3T26_13400 [Cryobacterium sp. TMT1-21]TFD16511.1 hypothetical protein E3T32_15090 [Cryobacterium sp. TMT2-23]TFD20479.1 hypothetical protein E3T42_02305 [Cryobacterium sp. TMT4-10]